jgi:hypothetical protein
LKPGNPTTLQPALAKTCRRSVSAFILLMLLLQFGGSLAQRPEHPSKRAQVQLRPIQTNRILTKIDKQQIARLEHNIPHLMAEGDILKELEF